MPEEFDFDWFGRGGRLGPVEPLRPRREGAGRALRSVKSAVNEPIPPEWDVLLALIEQRLRR
jgi:hypothetical protein